MKSGQVIRETERRKESPSGEEILMAEARRLGCHRTNEETVTAALDEYVRLSRRRPVLRVFGELEDEDPE